MEASRPKIEQSFAPSMWQELPVELLEIVLTKLPVPAAKKFCQVSKQWNAFFQSEEFARRCHSVQPTVCCLEHNLYLATPNPKTDSWRFHSLEFLPEDEMVGSIIATHQGLLCYGIRKKPLVEYFSLVREIVVVIHNPLTGKWRRLIVPYSLETISEVRTCEKMMLGGLAVEQETGSYKVVVAFISQRLTRKTFIYDSASHSWTTSAALSPVLGHFEYARWNIQRSICCGGELYWLANVDREVVGEEQMDQDQMVVSKFESLIKYNIKLDTWSTASRQLPSESENCQLHLGSLEDRVFMVSFQDSYIPPEFLSLVPSVETFDAVLLARLLKRVGDTTCLDELQPIEAVAEGGVWFIQFRAKTDARLIAFGKSEDFSQLRQDPPTVIRLPRRFVTCGTSLSLCTFAATFRAFV